MAEAAFWNHSEKARVDIERLKLLRSRIEPVQKVEARIQDLDATLELSEEEGGEDFLAEAGEMIEKVEQDVERIDLQLMHDGPYDHLNAYLAIQAGGGGTEACDWASLLLRMYLKWAEREGFKTETVDLLRDDESGGVKSATISFNGDYAYGFLKAEIGVHRLVRISPFDANKRRHTSFASVDVTPILPEEEEIDINEDELRIDTYRAGGAGGQHVNKTDSAVRITHLPTNIVVQCQNERSQHKNKSAAMKVLKAKLIARKELARDEELRGLSGEKGEIGFGHQIRSYVFQPYTLVKDHRTNLEVGNVQAVMDGDIRGFLEAFLRAQGNKKPGKR